MTAPRTSIPASTRVYAGTIIACVGLVCATVAGIFMDANKWHDLGHLLSSTPGQGSVAGLAIAAFGVWYRARHQVAP